MSHEDVGAVETMALHGTLARSVAPLCRVDQLPKQPRHGLVIVPTRGEAGLVGAGRAPDSLPHLGGAPMAGPLSAAVLPEVAQLEVSVRSPLPAMRHHVQDALAEVPAAHLAVVPPLERHRVQLVVVLRHQLVGQLVRVGVEVLCLMLPSRCAARALEGIVIEVPRVVEPALPPRGSLEVFEVVALAACTGVGSLALLHRHLLVDGIPAVDAPPGARMHGIPELDAAPHDHHPAVALAHGVVADQERHLADVRVVGEVILQVVHPHELEVVVEAQEGPPRGHNHHHLLARGEDKLGVARLEIACRDRYRPSPRRHTDSLGQEGCLGQQLGARESLPNAHCFCRLVQLQPAVRRRHE
mmetsp:Transcript_47870/g.153400  ORF Transcript_47870/g.153400 Transcript_47870/m.153400 type:complete len:356 (+) Transcript_47870:1057-2124(+)